MLHAIARSLAVLALVGLGVAGCGSVATGGAATSPLAPTATPPTITPTSSPAPTVKPLTATPRPSTDGAGAEYVTGTETITVTTGGTEEWVGKVEQIRGRVFASTDTMNDPRVTGTGIVQFSGDLHGTQTNGNFEGSVVAEWGTYRLENAEGAWEGKWTGANWNSGPTNVTSWLIGSGAYEGYTYYMHLWGLDPFNVEGIIFPGSPPAP